METTQSNEFNVKHLKRPNHDIKKSVGTATKFNETKITPQDNKRSYE